jgi:limonene-1,2-epoxide hydrolase
VNDVIERLAAAMNRHDLDAAVALVHPDYRSEQPLHPDRDFVGQSQMRANWTAMFAGIPDFHAEIVRSTQDGATTWTEWSWTGARTDGQPFSMRGITLFDVQDGQIVAGRLYMEDVDQGGAGIADAVRRLSGQPPDSPAGAPPPPP